MRWEYWSVPSAKVEVGGDGLTGFLARIILLEAKAEKRGRRRAAEEEETAMVSASEGEGEGEVRGKIVVEGGVMAASGMGAGCTKDHERYLRTQWM